RVFYSGPIHVKSTNPTRVFDPRVQSRGSHPDEYARLSGDGCVGVEATAAARFSGGDDGDARLPPPAVLFAGDLFSSNM
ncbi:unnamed protein product, partial [Urochloa humidicola]